jgi:hypothetical protein
MRSKSILFLATRTVLRVGAGAAALMVNANAPVAATPVQDVGVNVETNGLTQLLGTGGQLTPAPGARLTFAGYGPGDDQGEDGDDQGEDGDDQGEDGDDQGEDGDDQGEDEPDLA